MRVTSKDIAIYGAGGFGRETACLIDRVNSKQKEWNLIGFFDDNPELKGARNEYGEILGAMDTLNSWDKPLSVAIAIGTPNVRKVIVDKIVNPLIEFPNIIDPSVEFMDRRNVRFGKGNIVCVRSVISCKVTIGNFNLFNVAVGIGHDVTFGNYNVIMPNVNISGGVQIGDCNLFGVKSTVLQYLKIGNNVKIGGGSLMMRNGRNDGLYFGTPANRMNQ